MAVAPGPLKPGPVTRTRAALVASAVAIVVAAGVIVAAAASWFNHAVYEDRTLPVARTDVVVPRGTTFPGIVAALESKGVLAHPLAFRVLARLRHDDGAIKAGEYRFEPHQNSDAILRKLVAGEQAAIWVTIPEGFTAREIARTLAGHGLGDEAAYRRLFLQTPSVVAHDRVPDLEGYLFPSTYLIPVDATPASVARQLTGQFAQELPAGAAARAKALGYTVPQVVTVASLVEREGKADDERPLIAGVIYNRLRRGMPLEVDASIEYAFPEHKSVITKRDLELDSPYNTYRRQGLPPTPIANPGKPSLDAAFSPRPSDYLFYVYKGDGRHAFARTLGEHNANVAKYLH